MSLSTRAEKRLASAGRGGRAWLAMGASAEPVQEVDIKLIWHVCCHCARVKVGECWTKLLLTPDAVISHGICPSCAQKERNAMALTH